MDHKEFANAPDPACAVTVNLYLLAPLRRILGVSRLAPVAPHGTFKPHQSSSGVYHSWKILRKAGTDLDSVTVGQGPSARLRRPLDYSARIGKPSPLAVAAEYLGSV